MLKVRKANDRGHSNLGWLDSRHTFSFGDYYDPAHMGFGPLRVINDDRVAGGGGFPTHGHADMEIVTYVLDGALEHKDSLGTGSVIQAGEIQRMSAGTGIQHSEFNASKTDAVHFLQIWIVPERRGLAPSYEQKPVPREKTPGALRLIGARDGRDGSITIHQDVELYAARLTNGSSVEHAIKPGRLAWVQVAAGEAAINGTPVRTGDGVAIEDATQIKIDGASSAEILLFDLRAA